MATSGSMQKGACPSGPRLHPLVAEPWSPEPRYVMSFSAFVTLITQSLGQVRKRTLPSRLTAPRRCPEPPRQFFTPAAHTDSPETGQGADARCRGAALDHRLLVCWHLMIARHRSWGRALGAAWAEIQPAFFLTDLNSRDKTLKTGTRRKGRGADCRALRPRAAGLPFCLSGDDREAGG